jgi:hypothetical protein
MRKESSRRSPVVLGVLALVTTAALYVLSFPLVDILLLSRAAASIDRKPPPDWIDYYSTPWIWLSAETPAGMALMHYHIWWWRLLK